MSEQGKHVNRTYVMSQYNMAREIHALRVAVRDLCFAQVIVLLALVLFAVMH